MFESEYDLRRTASPVDRLFADLDRQIEQLILLYGNASYFDADRARRRRQALDAALDKTEGLVTRDERAPAASATERASGGNRPQRIESEITSFIQDMGKPVMIDEVHEHLTAIGLGEPRPSLITRMSRMAGAGKLTRSGRGYYELGEAPEA
ncbi:MAG: hypothetical protein ABTQ29_02410 [Siculibacillus sp.]